MYGTATKHMCLSQQKAAAGTVRSTLEGLGLRALRHFVQRTFKEQPCLPLALTDYASADWTGSLCSQKSPPDPQIQCKRSGPLVGWRAWFCLWRNCKSRCQACRGTIGGSYRCRQTRTGKVYVNKRSPACAVFHSESFIVCGPHRIVSLHQTQYI